MSSRFLVSITLLTAAPLSAQSDGTPFDPPRRTQLASARVDVPLTRIGDFYFVDVRVNGQPLRFTIETGASFFAISGSAVEALRLPVDTVTLTFGPSGPAPIARIATLTMGGATLSGVSALVTPMFNGMGFDGIISLPALHDLLATLDLGNNRLRLERGDLPMPNGNDIIPIAGRDRGRRIDVPIDVGGVTFAAVIDTRSFLGITLPDSAAPQLRLEAPPTAAGTARGPTLGTFQLSDARLAGNVRLGGVIIDRPSLVFRNRPGAVLGIPLLERLVITIDQIHQRVRVTQQGEAPIILSGRSTRMRGETPTAGEGEPARRLEGAPPAAAGPVTMGFNMAGSPGGGSLTIINVISGSDADRVGLKSGDQLVEFDGTPVASMNPTVFRAAIARGTPVKVIVTRDGRRMEFTIRPYIDVKAQTARQPVCATSDSAAAAAVRERLALWVRQSNSGDRQGGAGGVGGGLHRLVPIRRPVRGQCRTGCGRLGARGPDATATDDVRHHDR
ncbi:MAG: aspartyl protease family protein [Gemmatimonadaceae bacterium]